MLLTVEPGVPLLLSPGVPLTMPGVFVDRYDRSTGTASQPMGNGWIDAHDTHPTQFDRFELIGGNLVGEGTVRDSYTDDDPMFNGDYPVDPVTGEKYSPWIVTHRCGRRDIGQDDNYEIEMGWTFDVEQGGIVQFSPVIAVDLDAPGNQSGLLPAYDVSLDAAYWHVIPMTPDVASVFDPSYYHAVPGTGVPMDHPEPGEHQWRVRVEGGEATSWFDDQLLDQFTLPGWAAGRTHVGAHLVGIHCEPGQVYSANLPWTGEPAVVPPPVATSPYFRVRTW